MASKWRGGWLIILAVLVSAIGSFVLFPREGVYVSPDETANAFFAHTQAHSWVLYAFDALNIPLHDALHPRSVVSVEGRLMPQGFVGLPFLYGSLTWLTGDWFLPFVTAVLAAFAVCAWFGIVRRVFDREIALLSAILLALHPAWWYYTARSLMPNVPFASLIIIGLWLILARPVRAWTEGTKKAVFGKDADLVLGGIAWGFALMIRPAELVWLLLAAAAAALFMRATIRWRSVTIVAIALGIALAPLPLLQRSLYGSMFTSGYTVHAEEPDAPAVDTPVTVAPAPPSTSLNESPAWLAFQSFIKPVLPFGFHPRNAARNLFWYGGELFWWLTILALVGLPFTCSLRGLTREQKRARQVFLAVSACAGIWLVTLYGSWVFHDNPDPESISIANSYVRYWLPLFILSTPLIAFAVRWIANRALTPFARTLCIAVIVLLCAALNVRTVFFAPEDGLVPAAATMAQAAGIRDWVLQLTEPDAVIIVDRADKLFFPYRQVRYPLRDEETYALMPTLVLHAPLYYYGITFPETDMEYLNGEKLKLLGLQIELVHTFDEESLYRIYPIQ